MPGTGVVPANPHVLAKATFHPIALGQVYLPFAPEEDEKVVTSPYGARPITIRRHDQYEIRFDYIANAYVWLERVDPLSGRLKTSYCRTNQNGVLFDCRERDPAKMPQAPQIAGSKVLHKQQLVATTGSSFRVYWSVEPEPFKTFVDAVEAPGADRERVCAAFGVQRLSTTPYAGKQTHLELFEPNQNRSFPTYLLRDGGCFHPHPTLGKEFATFDVTPPTLRALYLTELVRWYAVRGPEQCGKHLAALWRAMQVIELTKQGWADAWLDKELAEQGPGALPKEGSPEREALEAYRDFAWQCARPKEGGASGSGAKPTTDRETFEASIQTYARDLGNGYRSSKWYAAASDAGQASGGRVVHPAFRSGFARERSRLQLGIPQRQYLLRYYDLYRLGFEFQARADYQRAFLPRVAAAFDGFQAQIATCQELQGQIFQRAPFVPFMTELARTYKDVRERTDLITRYVNASWNIGSPWWQEFEAASPVAAWKRLEPALKVMTKSAGAAAKLMEAFYSKPFAALVHDSQTANRAANHHHTLGVLTHGGGLLLDELPDELAATVELDVEGDRVRVFSDGHHPDVTDKPLLVRPKGTVRRWAQNLKQLGKIKATLSGGVIRIDNVPVPVSPTRLKQLRQELPAQLAFAANALNFSFAALTAVERFKAADPAGRFWICYDLGTGALSVADSVRALSEAFGREFRTISPVVNQVSKLKQGAGKVLTFVDAMRNFYGGYTLLFDSGDVAYELRHMGVARASVVSIKGATQIVVGATQTAEVLGLGSLGAATGEAAAAGAVSLPVTLLIVIGGTLVLCAADAYLAFTADAEAEIAAFRRALDDALGKQGPNPDAENQSTDPTLQVTRQLQTFTRFIEDSLLR